MKARVSESFEAPEKCCLFQLVLREYCILWVPCAYSFFEKGCRKKNVHSTIPKDNYMGYDQFTVLDTVAFEPTFVAFL